MESAKRPDRRLVLGGAAALVVGAFALRYNPYTADALRFIFPESIESPPARTISLDLRDSYTFVSAGDSLAAGLRGINDAHGVPESWVGPMVEQLNTTRRQSTPQHTGSNDYYPGWQYKNSPFLSRAGLTSGELLDTMRSPDGLQFLSAPYQAVLCLSVGFNDIYGFRNATPFDLVTRHTKLDTYQQNLQSIIDTFKTARLGKDTRPACMLLGLPDLDRVPAVAQAVRGTVLEGRTSLLAKEINQRMVAVCDRVDISMAYVDLFNHPLFSPKLISNDGLHPNAYGYEQIGEIAASTVRIAG